MAAPKLPRTDTLTGRALMRLMTGRKFTHRDYQEEAASIKDPTDRKATYARYSLNPEFLESFRAEMGERFDNFIQAVKRLKAKGEK